jgi:hypothetical protein
MYITFLSVRITNQGRTRTIVLMHHMVPMQLLVKEKDQHEIDCIIRSNISVKILRSRIFVRFKRIFDLLTCDLKLSNTARDDLAIRICCEYK